jgi:hypothetical protein
MRTKSRSRPIVALAAAYVIALQALLLPLSVAVGGDAPFSLCTAGASVAGAPSPVNHDNGCPCAAGCGMQCGVHALAGPPKSANHLTLAGTGALIPLPALVPAIRTWVRSPQVARAPPMA